MDIQIGKDYRLKSDPYNFILEERYDKKDKDDNIIGEGHRIIGYYATLEGLCKAVLKRSLHKSEATTVEELQQTLEGSLKAITEMVKGIDLPKSKKGQK
jgi:hypothetical protein